MPWMVMSRSRSAQLCSAVTAGVVRRRASVRQARSPRDSPLLDPRGVAAEADEDGRDIGEVHCADCRTGDDVFGDSVGAGLVERQGKGRRRRRGPPSRDGASVVGGFTSAFCAEVNDGGVGMRTSQPDEGIGGYPAALQAQRTVRLPRADEGRSCTSSWGRSASRTHPAGEQPVEQLTPNSCVAPTITRPVDEPFTPMTRFPTTTLGGSRVCPSSEGV